MREIKFRVFNKTENKYIYSEEFGDFLYPIHPLESFFEYIKDKIYLWDCELGNLEQFTGLQDKHGSDIYEGDILKTISYHLEKPELIIVKFDKFNKCGGCPHQDHGMGFSVGEYELDHLEIIGNINQNPELIGEQK